MNDDSGAAFVVTAVILLILAIALGAVLYIRRRRHSLERESGSIPLIVFPDAGSSGQFPARPAMRAEQWEPVVPAPVAPRVPPRDVVNTNTRDVVTARDVTAAAPSPTVSSVAAPRPGGLASDDLADDDVDDANADADAVIATESPAPRMVHPLADLVDSRPAVAPLARGNGAARPADGTLQFLPGRLEILEGQDAGQEIRFVRTGDPTEITFGRSEGPLYRHVQLREQTVSRVHARLTREGSQWRLTNLSSTNPLHVNGAPLDPPRVSVMLADGDRIEMGEVVLRYRGH